MARRSLRQRQLQTAAYVGAGVIGGGGYAFTNAEAAAVVAQFTVQPDNTRKALIDALVGGLKADGLWAKLGAIFAMSAHDQQAAMVNWKMPAGRLTLVNAPAFTPNQGFAGDAITSYVNTGLVPSTIPGWSQNSAYFGADIIGNNATTTAAIGGASGTRLVTLIPRTSGGRLSGKVNNASNVTEDISTTAVSRTAFVSACRMNDTEVEFSRNGVLVKAVAAASVDPAGQVNPITLGNDNAVLTTDLFRLFVAGAGLTQGERLALFNHWNTYKAGL